MGVTNSRRKDCVKEITYINQINSTPPGSIVASVPFEKWQDENYRSKYIFLKSADFRNVRGGVRGKGVLVRQDTTEGRFINVTVTGKRRLELYEPQTRESCLVDIPECNTSGKMVPRRRRLDHREVLRNFIQRQSIGEGICVIGCRDNLSVVQILDKTGNYIPEFYVIDMNKKLCVGKYPCPVSELVWHECYISPDLTQIILRPDFTICGIAPLETLSKVTVKYQDFNITYLTRFPDKSRCDIVCFDNRHQKDVIWRGADRTLILYDITEDKILKTSGMLALQAPIKQIKPSPSGEILAIRCVYPIYSLEYQVNVIYVLSAADFHLLLTIDAKGPYWPCSEIVNLQMFPQFSSCESSIAVMHNKVTKRKVHIYKLPNVKLSLQTSCRRVILMYYPHSVIEHLNLPKPLKQFLNYKERL